MGGTCLQGCPHPFAYRGLFWREEGAALGRVTPWWSLSAETVTGSSVAGTRQARGNQGLHSPMGQKSDKDEFWKVQRDNGKGCVSEPFVPAGPPMQALAGSQCESRGTAPAPLPSCSLAASHHPQDPWLSTNRENWMFLLFQFSPGVLPGQLGTAPLCHHLWTFPSHSAAPQTKSVLEGEQLCYSMWKWRTAPGVILMPISGCWPWPDPCTLAAVTEFFFQLYVPPACLVV